MEPSRHAWIRVLQPDEAPQELLDVYDEYKIPYDEVDNILSIHSLSPESLRGHMLLYRHIMYGPSPLTRPEREMIAVTVSTLNECHY